MRRIASRQNPIVQRFRAAARRDGDGRLLLDGPHLVSDAIDAGVRIHEVAVAAAALDDPDIAPLIDRLVRTGVDASAATAPVMAALSPVRSPSRIAAVADCPARGDAMFSGQPLLVVASNVQDPGNLGAIVRVAEAGGADGVIASGASADPFGWKALRGSMGSALRLPILAEKDGVYPALRRHGCRILAAAPRSGRPLFEVNLTGALALVIGGEGSGLSASEIGDADEVVTIPMRAPVESLNAAVTAALLVYEARRQRS